jgi:hypothetical protein
MLFALDWCGGGAGEEEEGDWPAFRNRSSNWFCLFSFPGSPGVPGAGEPFIPPYGGRGPPREPGEIIPPKPMAGENRLCGYPSAWPIGAGDIADPLPIPEGGPKGELIVGGAGFGLGELSRAMRSSIVDPGREKDAEMDRD